MKRRTSQVSVCSSSRQSISIDESGLFNFRIQAISKQPNILAIEEGIEHRKLNQEQSIVDGPTIPSAADLKALQTM